MDDLLDYNLEGLMVYLRGVMMAEMMVKELVDTMVEMMASWL